MDSPSAADVSCHTREGQLQGAAGDLDVWLAGVVRLTCFLIV